MMHTCIYILLIVWLFVYIEFEIGCVLPREIQRIIGNECFFQLHLDEYNLKYGGENYTVLKILETEISHKVERHQVIIKLKSISIYLSHLSTIGFITTLYMVSPIYFIYCSLNLKHTLHLTCYMILNFFMTPSKSI